MYDYQEYRPDILLMPWVENYWTSINFKDFGEIPKVFPDGCTDIIFKFDRTRRTYSADIFGTMTSFIEVDYPEYMQMFGIRFKPAGITAFTRIPANEFTDISVELALVQTLFNESFYQTVAEKQSMAEIVEYTNSYLKSLLPSLYRLDRQIIRAVDLISLTKGKLPLAAVASDVCLCQRHFERKFKSIIGVSPKMFAKINRFKHAKKCLRDYPHKDLLTIAVECGYYDHAHLIKDFKTFSGDAPTDFRL
jgi:AraC-like DNA-binding protein